MIGETGIAQVLPFDEVCLTTYDMVYRAVSTIFYEESSQLKDNVREAMVFVQHQIDKAHESILHLVQRFMGDEPDVTGGSLGEPNCQDLHKYVFPVSQRLEIALQRTLHQQAIYPLSVVERKVRVLSTYIWRFVDSWCGDNDDEARGFKFKALGFIPSSKPSGTSPSLVRVLLSNRQVTPSAFAYTYTPPRRDHYIEYIM